jgi:16S rRNA (uracil1498-N3)-methyltransferase
MRTPRIFTDQLLASDSHIPLEPGPSQHLARALRMSVGDPLVLFDGRGGEYPAEIAELDKRQVTVTTGRHRDRECESPLSVHLGIGVSRGERMDWVVQKATELGISEISPLLSERTEVKLRAERVEKKLEHWRRIAISACEQCGRNRLPRLNTPLGLPGWLEAAEAERKYVLHHRAGPGAEPDSPPASVILLIGPEGGLTEDEIERAVDAGYEALQLGPRVLRTETAPLAALAILQARWGDMAG